MEGQHYCFVWTAEPPCVVFPQRKRQQVSFAVVEVGHSALQKLLAHPDIHNMNGDAADQLFLREADNLIAAATRLFTVATNASSRGVPGSSP